MMNLFARKANDPRYVLFTQQRILSMILGIPIEDRGNVGFLLAYQRGSECRDLSELVYSVLRVSSSLWKDIILLDHRKLLPVVFVESTA